MTNSFISQSLVVLLFFSHTHAFLKKSYSFSLYLWQISFRHLYSEKNAFKKTLCFVKNAKKNPTFFYKNAHNKITLLGCSSTPNKMIILRYHEVFSRL